MFTVPVASTGKVTLMRSVLIDRKFNEKTIPSGNMGMSLYMNSVYNGWIHDNDPLMYLNKSIDTDILLEYDDDQLRQYSRELVSKYIIGADVKYNMVSVPDSEYQKRVDRQLQYKAEQELSSLSQ